MAGVMDVEKETAFLTERKSQLDYLLMNISIMEKAIENLDQDRLDKMKRDFNHVLNQLEYIEKRSN